MLAGLLLVTSCQRNTFSLTVNFPDKTADGQYVYLLMPFEHRIMDSLMVENKTAVFTGKLERPTLVQVVSYNNTQGVAMLETGNVSVMMSNPYETRSATAGLGNGTPLNDELVEMITLTDSLADIANYFVGTEEESAAFWKEWQPQFVAMWNTYYERNRDNDLGAYAFTNLLNFTEDQNKRLELVDNASNYVKSIPDIITLIVGMQAAAGTTEGNMFTDFTVEETPGQKVSFSDFIGKGQYVLVDFWASWCAPCREEVPNLKEVYAKYNGPDFTILGVAVWDNPEDTYQAIEELQLPWHSIINAQKIPTDVYNIEGIPHLILFGPDGTIVARGLRGDAIGAKVAEVLGK